MFLIFLQKLQNESLKADLIDILGNNLAFRFFD